MALAFPLHPPGAPERSRAGEAALVTRAAMAIIVIQGARDPFGSPAEVANALGTGAQVVAVAGTHSFTKNPVDVVAAARSFLEKVA